MRRIGLTGGIATGKSTVSALLAERGATVVDADSIARDVVAPGQPALVEIADRFGPSVLDGQGRLDRGALAAVVFTAAGERRALERITHPRIVEVIGERVEAARCAGVRVVVIDVPLLLEQADPPEVDGVLLVDASEETQLRRLRERDGLDEAAARSRLAAQLPRDEKRRRATWIIDNDGDIAGTVRQVDRWWREHGHR